ncbi:MAG: dihydrofolate reductase family protein [Methanomassiliicoccales archaeon]|nr:dihydrofolate reductase family protein [Methanomassiliicoccales archaeon]
MRRIRVFNRVTPEGYFTGADSDYRDMVVMDGELDKDMMADTSPVTYLFGRKTYELMAAFWPGASQDPKLSPAMQKMARTLNDDAKIVFSKTLKNPTWQNTRIIPNLDPNQIRKMKKEKGSDMLVLGSGSIVSQLTQHGLIDEYMLVVSPRLLGKGRPLFDGVTTKTSLELKEAKGYPSGNVLLRYGRV